MRYLADELPSFLRLLDVQGFWGFPADALHPVQIWPVLFLKMDTHATNSFSNSWPVAAKKYQCWLSLDGVTYIALQPVGLLGPGHIHVTGQSRVLMKESPVVGVGCQVLSLLGVADVYHVQVKTGDENDFTQWDEDEESTQSSSIFTQCPRCEMSKSTGLRIELSVKSPHLNLVLVSSYSFL